MNKFAGLIGLALLCGFAPKGDPSEKVDNFTLEDYNGVRHSLNDYKNSKAIVIMFIATRCPVSNSYNGRMNELVKDYTGKHVAFIGINSNNQESVEEIKNHAHEKGFEFPILKDWKNVIADKLGATVTPEIYVLNPGLEILYHGRIDNSSKEDKVTSKDLRNALDEILNGKPVAVTSTKAFGCTIKKVD
ncbi:MAG TPA: thioredoxin family protein [Bacteroidota bacterium]